MTEELLRMVSQEARTQNDWQVDGIDVDGTGNAGVIRFYREHCPTDSHHGTARFKVRGDLVAFEHGHYDLSLRGSREDFSTRIAQGR